MVNDNNRNNRRGSRGNENIVVSFELSKKPIGQIDSHTTIVDCEIFRFDNPNEIFLTKAHLPSDLYLDILLEKSQMVTNDIYDFHFATSMIDNYDLVIMELNNDSRVINIENGVLSGFSEDYSTEISKEFN